MRCGSAQGWLQSAQKKQHLFIVGIDLSLGRTGFLLSPGWVGRPAVNLILLLFGLGVVRNLGRGCVVFMAELCVEVEGSVDQREDFEFETQRDAS